MLEPNSGLDPSTLKSGCESDAEQTEPCRSPPKKVLREKSDQLLTLSFHHYSVNWVQYNLYKCPIIFIYISLHEGMKIHAILSPNNSHIFALKYVTKGRICKQLLYSRWQDSTTGHNIGTETYLASSTVAKKNIINNKLKH